MNAQELYEDLDDESKRTLNVLANNIVEKYPPLNNVEGEFKGRVILFLGAAVNYQAPKGFEKAYSELDRPPLANELCIKLIDDLSGFGMTDDEIKQLKQENLPLSWVSQYFEQYKNCSRRDLIKKLSDHIDNFTPSPILKALAEMPFKYIVTTNYDCLFEEALNFHNKRSFKKGVYKPNYTGATYTDNIHEEEVTILNPFVYKLHGDIKEVINDNGDYIEDKDAIVITEDNYLQFILRMSQSVDIKEKGSYDNYYPIPQVIKNALNGVTDKTFLFIGYGLKDYNLRLLLKTAKWKTDNPDSIKRIQKWSIDVSPDKVIKTVMINDYKLTFIEQDVWCTIPYLYKIIFNKEMPL